MSLETSRKILKIVGILGIISSVFVFFSGILVTVGGGYVGTQEGAKMATEAGISQQDASKILWGGIVIILSGIFYFIEGFVSVRASKDNKYGKAAVIFAMIGIASAIVNAISQFSTNGVNVSTIIGAVVGCGLSGLIYAAANEVKKAGQTE